MPGERQHLGNAWLWSTAGEEAAFEPDFIDQLTATLEHLLDIERALVPTENARCNRVPLPEFQ